MPFITQGKTNWKYILVVMILAVIVASGTWLYLAIIGGWPELKKPTIIEISVDGKIEKLVGIKLPISKEEAIYMVKDFCESKYPSYQYDYEGIEKVKNEWQVKIPNINCICGATINEQTGEMKCQVGLLSTDETADWKTYQWNELEFNYPPTWTVEKIYYQTPAQQAKGEPPENIGLAIFPGAEPTENDFIAIGGHQVSCDPSENHTKCQFISYISDFIYTDSNNPDILNAFEQMLSTFRFLEASALSEVYKTWFDSIIKGDWYEVFRNTVTVKRKTSGWEIEGFLPISEDCQRKFKNYYNKFVNADYSLKVGDVTECNIAHTSGIAVRSLLGDLPCLAVSVIYNVENKEFSWGQSVDGLDWPLVKFEDKWKVLVDCPTEVFGF